MPLHDLEGRPLPDPWAVVEEDAPLPPEPTPILVAWSRWNAGESSLVARPTPLGVALPNDLDLAVLRRLGGRLLGRLALIALTFPSFRDGRAYTQARLLRERHGFTGEIRATGDMGRDQIALIRRCGFDTMVLPVGTPWIGGASPLPAYPLVYQPAADGRETIAALRLKEAPAPLRLKEAPAPGRAS